MISIVAAACLLALTRAEIIERMRAPVVTQADGLVQVFAGCPEDMRREFQAPIARFAADTAKMLYGGLAKRPVRFAKPGILIHVGDVRTNLTDVVSRVSTNDSRIVTRIYVKAPGYADLRRLRMEVIKAFYRSVEGRELSDAEAVAVYRHADPAMRVADERMQLEDWLKTGTGLPDEDALKLLRKVIEPGRASRRDILTFASRLFLYPPEYDVRFVGRHSCLSFADALRFHRIDPTIRIMATLKANEIPVFGGGRSEEMSRAADAYQAFLLALGAGKLDDRELGIMLDEADTLLNIAFEKASP